MPHQIPPTLHEKNNSNTTRLQVASASERQKYQKRALSSPSFPFLLPLSSSLSSSPCPLGKINVSNFIRKFRFCCHYYVFACLCLCRYEHLAKDHKSQTNSRQLNEQYAQSVANLGYVFHTHTHPLALVFRLSGLLIIFAIRHKS